MTTLCQHNNKNPVQIINMQKLQYETLWRLSNGIITNSNHTFSIYIKPTDKAQKQKQRILKVQNYIVYESVQ